MILVFKSITFEVIHIYICLSKRNESKLSKMQNYRFPDPQYEKIQKSLTFHANCRNSSPSKLLGGRITGVGENPGERGKTRKRKERVNF